MKKEKNKKNEKNVQKERDVSCFSVISEKHIEESQRKRNTYKVVTEAAISAQ